MQNQHVMKRVIAQIFVLVLLLFVLTVSLAWAAVCGKCGAKVDDAAKFCPECGTKMTAEAQPVGPPPYDGKPGTTAGQQCVNPKDGAVMVWVPAGEFIMGTAKSSAKNIYLNQLPQRKVTLDGFWMYQTEVTVAQYKAYCVATDMEMPKNAPPWGWKDTHPMVNVSWGGARAYAKWAGAKLPSEAQWEKAARGTDGRLYPWGNTWDPDKCNNALTGLEKTMPVGSFPDGASPYGCLDMAGNVNEWCEDWYDEKYYQTAPTTNPPGPDGGKYRVLRGGSWGYDNPLNFPCAYRNYSLPTNRGLDFGFRCVLSPQGH